MKNYLKQTCGTLFLLGSLSGSSFAGVSDAELGLAAQTADGQRGGVLGGVTEVGRGIAHLPGKIAGVRDDGMPMLSQGTQEFGLAGNINWGDDIAYNADLQYGWFFADSWLFGIDFNVNGIEDDVNFGLGLFTEYNFNTNTKWVPFVGASAKWAHLGSDALDADSIAMGGEIGIKYYLRSNLALTFSVALDWAFDDVFPGEDSLNKQLNIGTRFSF